LRVLVEGPVDGESKPLTVSDMATLARLLRMKSITRVQIVDDTPEGEKPDDMVNNS
jgi:hypothetical protein